MRFIPAAGHNIIDYIYGALIFASPWLTGYAKNGPETILPAAAGTAIIFLSLVTDYKYSLKKIIAYNAHLKLELFIGLLLAISPWFFGFYAEVYLPHLVSGFFCVVLSLLSKRFINYKAYD